MKDLARIYVKAGDGGDGKVSFRHEKFAPKGGPDGGDGGRGGDVVLVADRNIDNLIEFNYQKKFVAQDGEAGQIKKMHGKDREPTSIKVPVGTTVYEIPKDMAEVNLRERDEFEQVLKKRVQIVDMDEHAKQYVAAYGGRGGRGNDHFKSSTNQTPREAEPGKRGEEKWLIFEHKVVADIGIVGLPNVGKSSLLKALTRANPKIAGYPFTTLEPNLGVMIHKSRIKNQVSRRSLVLVDVPGVVEDAWEGKGIGPWFMRHLERTKSLFHILAPDPNRGEDYASQMIEDYRVVRKELEKYASASSAQVGKGLDEKDEVVVINKMELVDEDEREKVGKEIEKKIGKSVEWVSASMGEGLEQIVDRTGIEPVTSTMP